EGWSDRALTPRRALRRTRDAREKPLDRESRTFGSLTVGGPSPRPRRIGRRAEDPAGSGRVGGRSRLRQRIGPGLLSGGTPPHDRSGPPTPVSDQGGRRSGIPRIPRPIGFRPDYKCTSYPAWARLSTSALRSSSRSLRATSVAFPECTTTRSSTPRVAT